MNKEELRQLIYRVLLDQPRTQFSGVKTRVHNQVDAFEAEDDLLIHEILWELLVQGVLAPGMNVSNLDFPFIHVTDYGYKVIQSGESISQDPEQYVEHLKAELPLPLDPVVQRYLQEAVHTFYASAYLSAIAMLGIAAERCVDVLFGRLAETLNDSGQKARYLAHLTKIRTDLKAKFAFLRSELFSWDFPPAVREGIDVQLSAIYFLMRQSRDEAGLYMPAKAARETVQANLLLFPEACRWIYAILAELDRRAGVTDESEGEGESAPESGEAGAATPVRGSNPDSDPGDRVQ